MKAKNLWRKIVDAVKRLFGIKADGAEETTAYKEVSAALDKMLETFDEGLYQQYVGKKVLPSQVERANLVLIPPPAVLFKVLPIALQTPWESPLTLQKYEIFLKKREIT